MKLVALIALDMAFLRAHPFLVLLQSCNKLFVFVMLDLVIIQYFILGRRLGAFHCTFLVVGLIASLTLHTFCGDSWGILRTSIGLYLGTPGLSAWTPKSLRYLWIGDRCLTSILVLLLSWAAGLWMALASRRQSGPGMRDRDITSFFLTVRKKAQ